MSGVSIISVQGETLYVHNTGVACPKNNPLPGTSPHLVSWKEHGLRDRTELGFRLGHL